MATPQHLLSIVPRSTGLVSKHAGKLYDLDVATKQNNTEQRSVQLANVLQSTLEVKELIELFSKQLAELIAFDSFRYEHLDQKIEYDYGPMENHSCAYELVLLDFPLGSVIITRKSRFSTAEQLCFETLLCSLVYPLRNAILYRQALETALKDPVSGTNNRTAMEATLNREVDLAHRHKCDLSIILLDIDHFKRVNDTYGHVAGDMVLRELGRCLIDCVRRSDMVFRYGGEEFVVVLSNTDIGGATLLGHRIRESVEARDFKYSDVSMPISVSIGVADLAENYGPEEILQLADKALYQAKRSGRNRVVTAAAVDLKS